MPEIDVSKTIPMLLIWAWLLPLGAFGVLLFFAPWLDRRGRAAGWLATGAVAGSFLLSLLALGFWVAKGPTGAEPAGHSGQTAGVSSQTRAPSENPTRPITDHTVHQPDGRLESIAERASHQSGLARPGPIVGRLFSWARFGRYEISLTYYIDTLTVLMCMMVSLVALCIHIYSLGYMAEELHEVSDPLVQAAGGGPLRRPGRFGRFFQYLSLFVFSMLGLVLAGHLVMIFMFWELVGLCSYFLIGFYRERPSAQAAAMKAFVVNRVGDMGFLVGLMALGGLVGTWSLGDMPDSLGQPVAGVFTQLHELLVGQSAAAEGSLPSGLGMPSGGGFSRTLWILAAVGIFCGCVGKSAQFPLHVWLPDAMEGPTPVSALIHAATMVAAGVYLVGRFYPAFPPEVLLVIAVVGTITLLIGATIALVATDIKRVLAYSTISQLGYMMLGLGVGGWAAGLLHLVTHAFFKALLFLCSGSVIHAVGTNEMPQMGALRRKMPWTAWTMLVGCLAIAGAGLPGLVGLSGFYSKEAILAQVYLFCREQPAVGGWLFAAALAGAGLTAFYMFRLWYMTFAGPPKDEHIFHHAHESPPVMVGPLVVLAGLAIVAGWRVPGTSLSLQQLLDRDRPVLLAAENAARYLPGVGQPGDRTSAESGTSAEYGKMQPLAGSPVWPVVIPEEHRSHDPGVAGPVGWMAFAAALAGFLLATAIYGMRKLAPERIVQAAPAVYTFLKNKWYFDQLYEAAFVRPVLRLADGTVDVDRQVLDRTADGMARGLIRLARMEDWLDRRWVDALFNRSAEAAYRLGLGLRRLQTGELRQYVLWAVLGAVAIFVLVSLGW